MFAAQCPLNGITALFFLVCLDIREHFLNGFELRFTLTFMKQKGLIMDWVDSDQTKLPAAL